jgi:hypothetical protein
MLASLASDADVRAQTRHFPQMPTTGMGFLHPQNVANPDI